MRRSRSLRRKLKGELARILVEQGYIDSWAVVPAPEGGAGQLIEIRLKYTEDRRSAISGPAPRLAAGPAHVRRREAHPEGARRHGHVDRFHLPWRDDRPRRARGGRRRRGPRAGLVRRDMSRIGRQPIPVPAGVTIAIEPGVGPRERSQRRAVRAHLTRTSASPRTASSCSSRGRPTAANTARCTA